MFCTNCGNQVPDGQSFCSMCGTQLVSTMQPNNQNAYNQSQYEQQNTYSQPQYGQQNMYQQPQYAQQNAYQQPQYGQQNTYQQPQYLQQNMYGQQNTYMTPVNNQPQGMLWFYFIIWVQLFLNAALNVRTGVMAMTGAQYELDGYGNVSGTIYRIYENLQMYDTVYGISLIVLAVLAIFVRFRLSGYKKNGPMLYLVLLGANIVIPLIYAFFASEEINATIAEVLNGSELNFIGCIVLFFINIFYFHNRKDKFVN